MPERCEIIEGGLYTYVRGIPECCHGERYRLHRRVLDVPSYQHKVLVEALTGPDKGLWFTCTLDNFSTRYELVKEIEATTTSEEKVAGGREGNEGRG